MHAKNCPDKKNKKENECLKEIKGYRQRATNLDAIIASLEDKIDAYKL